MNYSLWKGRVLARKIVQTGPNTKIVLCLKTIGDQDYLEIRRWYRFKQPGYKNSDEEIAGYYPSKKGIMYPIKYWVEELIPTIQEYANWHNNRHNRP